MHWTDPLGLFPDSVTTTCARDPVFCASVGLISAGTIGTATVTIPNTVPDSDVENDLYCPPDNAIFAKGGKQNIDNEYVRLVQNQRPPDPCEFLNKLYNAENNKKERDKINKARKRFNCDGKNRFK